jgi:2-C-methyl-D-erythritol 4-phosphate cytidylyltransferase
VQQKYIIIGAGGTGSRMQSDIPKQFIELGGEAIIVRTIKTFLNYDAAIQIIISVHKDFKTYLEDLCAKNDLMNIKIVLGGETRFHSVKNGLDLVTDQTAIIGIHDAARPFVSLQTIKNCFDIAKEKGNATPCITITESLRSVNAEKNMSVNRNDFKIIQTPQCFLASKIKKAFLQEYNASFTDDATVLESIGDKINLVEGNIDNIKITNKFDLAIANALLNNE